MATVNKCDRCGIYYKTGEGSVLGVDGSRGFITTYKIELDICPDCESSLVEWLRAKEEKQEEKTGEESFFMKRFMEIK